MTFLFLSDVVSSIGTKISDFDTYLDSNMLPLSKTYASNTKHTLLNYYFVKDTEYFKIHISPCLSVCTLAINTDNNIMQSNDTQKEYLQQLNVRCKTGYKLSHTSDNSATSTTLYCLESGAFEPPPVCVKKGKYIRMIQAKQNSTCICLITVFILTSLLCIYQLRGILFN